MIVFDLACGAGHVFEAWFGSSADYEAQRERGLVSCPLCGSADVGKAVMAPHVGAKSNQLPAPSAPQKPVPMASAATPSIAEMKQMMRALADAQARALEKSDYVGGRFAEEARAIHEGESEQRPIHGQATPDEAKSLVEDGIEVMPLPFPVRPAGSEH
jgi:hypothetical protein